MKLPEGGVHVSPVWIGKPIVSISVVLPIGWNISIIRNFRCGPKSSWWLIRRPSHVHIIMERLFNEITHFAQTMRLEPLGVLIGGLPFHELQSAFFRLDSSLLSGDGPIFVIWICRNFLPSSDAWKRIW